MTGQQRILVTMIVACLPSHAYAQDKYPNRTVEVVNPYQAGGTTDALARVLALGLSKHLGGNFMVMNKPGAGGAIGAASVARANPDGYTLLFAPALIVSVLPQARSRAVVGYDASDLVPVCQTFSNTMGLVVRGDSAIRNLNDLVVAAREKPGVLSYGHQGISTIPQLAMEEFLEAAKIKINGIPFGGDPAVITDLLGGRTDVSAVVLGAVSIIDQNARIIGVFADKRHPSFPEAPTVPEQGYNVTPTSFGGIFVRKGTPDGVIATLASACGKAALDETYQTTARKVAQPLDYYAERTTFADRLSQDITVKERLLRKLGQTAQ